MAYEFIEGTTHPSHWIGLTVATTADLATQPVAPSPQGLSAHVKQNGGSYWSWYPTGSTVPAGAQTIGGSGGVWANQAFGQVTSFVPVQADTTGVASAVAGITAALAAAVTLGLPVWFPPGTYLIDSVITVPSNVTLLGERGTVSLKGAISIAGSPTTGAMFKANSVVLNSGTVQAANTVGATTIPATIKPSVGAWIYVITSDGLHGSCYRVLSATGASSPYTVTVDRPVLYAFTNTSLFYELTSRPEHIVFDGLTFIGACTRYIELAASYRCAIRNCVFDGSNGGGWSDQACSFDIGSTYCHYENCLLIGGTNNQAGGLAGDGLDFESNEGSWHHDCVIQGEGHMRYGIALYDCTDCEVRGPDVSGCVSGLWLGADLTTPGCNQCRVIGGTYYGNSASGIAISASVGTAHPTGNRISSAVCRYNGTDGITLAAGIVVTDTIVTGCVCTNNTGAGVNVPSDAVGTVITGTDGSSCAQGFLIAAATTCAGITALGCTTAAIETLAGSYGVTVSGFQFSLGAGSFCVYQQNKWLSLTDGTIDPGAGGYGIAILGTASICRARGVQTTRGAFGVYIASGATLRQGDGCVFTATTPVDVVAGGFYNRKQTSAGSAGGVAVSWPDINADDEVILIPTAAVFSGWVSAITPGTGFTIKDAASGTYEYFIP